MQAGAQPHPVITVNYIIVSQLQVLDLTNNIIELKYINDINEWWSIDAANSGKLNIPEGEDCKKQ